MDKVGKAMVAFCYLSVGLLLFWTATIITILINWSRNV